MGRERGNLHKKSFSSWVSMAPSLVWYKEWVKAAHRVFLFYAALCRVPRPERRNGVNLCHSNRSDFFSPREAWRDRRMLAGAETWPWMGEDDLLLTSLDLFGGGTTFIYWDAAAFLVGENLRLTYLNFHSLPPVGSREIHSRTERRDLIITQGTREVTWPRPCIHERPPLLLLSNKVTLSLHLLMIFKI